MPVTENSNAVKEGTVKQGPFSSLLNIGAQEVAEQRIYDIIASRLEAANIPRRFIPLVTEQAAEIVAEKFDVDIFQNVIDTIFWLCRGPDYNSRETVSLFAHRAAAVVHNIRVDYLKILPGRKKSRQPFNKKLMQKKRLVVSPPIINRLVKTMNSLAPPDMPEVQEPATAILKVVANAVKAGDVDTLTKMLASAECETTEAKLYKPPPSKLPVHLMTPEQRRKKNEAAKIYNATYRKKRAKAATLG